MVNLSHNGYRIEQYFGDGARHGLQMGYSFEGYLDRNDEIVPQPLGSAGALRKIEDFGGFFDDTTLVLCGNTIIDLDIKAALPQHKATGALASVIVKEVPWESVGSYGVMETATDGRIQSFQEKPQPNEARSNLASTGIYIFEPEALALIPADQPFDIGSDCYIDRDAQISNSVVMPGSYIGEKLLVEKAIIAGKQLIRIDLGIALTIDESKLLSSNGNSTSALLRRIPEQVIGAALLLMSLPL